MKRRLRTLRGPFWPNSETGEKEAPGQGLASLSSIKRSLLPLLLPFSEGILASLDSLPEVHIVQSGPCLYRVHWWYTPGLMVGRYTYKRW